MTIKEYVANMLNKANLSRNVNKEAELWNVLYNVLNDLSLKHSDVYDTENEELVSYINSYEAMYFNDFPKESE